MCGIYGLLSSRHLASRPGEEFFRHLDALIEGADPSSLSSTLSKESAQKRLVKDLEAAEESAERWTGRASFLAVLGDSELAQRLDRAIVRTEQWVDAVESLAVSSRAVVEEHRELLNRLALTGKDIAWKLRKDVLENLSSVRELAPDDAPETLARAYELNLILRSLDRLEVRGRDSAGIAVYVRFGSGQDLEAFLAGTLAGESCREQVASRFDARLVDGAILRPRACASTLLFTFKVASEVGKMGDNVASLRRDIREDPVFQAALGTAGVQLQSLAHTRWASNGVISLPNCHPVDSSVLRDGDIDAGSLGNMVAVLNGDIDNYQQLVERYVMGSGLGLDPSITTDAKIIPVVVDHYYRQSMPLEEAFQLAFAEFEGSMAIGLMAADRPGEFLFGQKGSGQGLFLGSTDESTAVASEMYGVVELTSNYVKAEGERIAEGEVFRLSSADEGVVQELYSSEGWGAVPRDRWQTAEITTRDINRAGYPHFFLKEISESIESVRNTIRGKFERSESNEVRFCLGADTLPLPLVAGLRDGKVRTVCVIGQGTAAVAAQGVAHLLDHALRGLPHAVSVHAEKATEFSAHRLRDDMSDTLVVAVSQSGTTTDTNRTVDLARQRGAWVLGIVNRRNSDLVYKSHAVLYTSDGRDIEMSVASTKAFYAQNVAGQILALALASALGSMPRDELQTAVSELEQLPSLLEKTLEQQDRVAQLAQDFALRRRHWAVVGSGASKIAADEIRIKLSELCYKSIAVDYLEDKKHIDLSSEPLVIVCAVGMAREVISDAVKEVAIFKAHNAIPLVITEEGVTGFDPYAAGTVKVPSCGGALSFLPATMAGHLFGYHAAAAMDRVADTLRSLRARVVGFQEACSPTDDAMRSVLDQVSSECAEALVGLEERLDDGALDGGLDVSIAVRLSRVINLLLGRVSVDGFQRPKSVSGGALEALLSVLSDSIAELSRPIDAIKHQAKTVTVGISRGDASVVPGAITTRLDELGIAQSELLESHRNFVAAFDPLVASADGVSLYRVTGLDALGRPVEGSEIQLASRHGSATEIASRSESRTPLSGNKWGVIKRRRLFLGCGQHDERKILMLPLVGEDTEARVALFHLTLKERGASEQRLKALAANEALFDRLKAAVTEVQLDWDPSLIDRLDNDTLFFNTPEKVAELLAHAHV